MLYRVIPTVALAGILLVPMIGAAQSPPSSPGYRAAVTQGEKAWVKHTAALHVSCDKQISATNSRIMRIVNNVSQVKSKEGIEAFIEEAMSLKSKSMWATDQTAHRRWLRDLFKKHVVPVQLIHQIIAAEANAIDKDLAAIDNELLIELKADIAFDPASIVCPAISTEAIDKHIDAVADKVCAEVDTATYKSLAAFLAGVAGGETTRQISRSALADQHGNVSIFNEIVSLAIGIAGDIVTTEIASEALGTRTELRSQINKLANDVLRSIVTEEGEVLNTIVATFGESVREHRAAIIGAVAKEWNIEAEWGNAVFSSVK